jgi:hypothetical protein
MVLATQQGFSGSMGDLVGVAEGGGRVAEGEGVDEGVGRAARHASVAPARL